MSSRTVTVAAVQSALTDDRDQNVARMSERPEDGVTNRWGRVHDVPNLYVTDGSLFTSSGAPNPTLTIVAPMTVLGIFDRLESSTASSTNQSADRPTA